MIKVENILVVPAGKLGDIVCTTPLLAAIRKHLPEAKIFLHDASGTSGDLLSGTNLVDEFVSLDSFSAVRALVRKHGIDCALFAGFDVPSLRRLLLSGVRNIVTPFVKNGFCPQQTLSFRLMATITHRVEFRFGEYMPAERLKVLNPLGIFETDTTKHLFVEPAALADFKKLLAANGLGQDKKLVGISLSAGNKIKEWPVERFVDVAKHIQKDYGFEIIILGGKTDLDLSRDFERINRERSCGIRYFDATGKLDLGGLKAAISCLDFFVAVDTGPIYVAEALGIPTVDIVGPMDEREQPPRVPPSKVVVPAGRKEAQLHILNARIYNEVEARRQVEAISVAMVTDSIDSLVPSLVI